MMSNRFTLGALLAAACGVGLTASNAEAYVLTEDILGTRYSARDTNLDGIGDVTFLTGSVGPSIGSFSTTGTNSTFIFEVPNVANPFTDITAADLGGSLFQNATAVGFNIDMVLYSYTAAFPAATATDYENLNAQVASATDVLADDWAVPGTLAAVPLASVDMLSYLQNNYIPGGGYLKIGLAADSLPAVGSDYVGRYRVRGSGGIPLALTTTYDNGLAPPIPELAIYDFNVDTVVPVTGVSPFFSKDPDEFSGASTASNVDSGQFLLDSGHGTPAKSLFHGDPKWLVETEANAVAGGFYVGFDVQPDSPGDTLDLAELEFDVQMDNSDGGLNTWALYGDLDPSDGLDDFVKLFDGTNTIWGDAAVPTNWEHISIDLTGLAYQDVDAAAFRIYRWHEGGFPLNATINSRMDNLILRGVPEPASLMLMGLGALACLKRKAV